MKIIELTGTTNASGVLSISGTKSVTGYLEKIFMDYDDSTDTADLTFTSTYNGSILVQANAGSVDKIWYPRSLANKSTDGSAFANVAERFYFADEKLDVAVAQGGSVTNLRFIAVFSDE